MTEPWNQGMVDRLIGRLSHQDLERILGNLLWDFFGDLEDAAHAVGGAFRPAAHDHPLAALLQARDVRGCRFEHVDAP